MAPKHFQALGDDAWWMHEKCMVGDDEADYAAMVAPLPSDEPSNSTVDRSTEANGEQLPDGWKKKQSKTTGKYYYEHKATKGTQWHPPSAEDRENDKSVQKEDTMETEKKGKRNALERQSDDERDNEKDKQKQKNKGKVKGKAKEKEKETDDERQSNRRDEKAEKKLEEKLK